MFCCGAVRLRLLPSLITTPLTHLLLYLEYLSSRSSERAAHAAQDRNETEQNTLSSLSGCSLNHSPSVCLSVCLSICLSVDRRQLNSLLTRLTSPYQIQSNPIQSNPYPLHPTTLKQNYRFPFVSFLVSFPSPSPMHQTSRSAAHLRGGRVTTSLELR